MNHFVIQYAEKKLKIEARDIQSDGRFDVSVNGTRHTGRWNSKLRVLQISCDGFERNFLVRTNMVVATEGDLASIMIEAQGTGGLGASALLVKREREYPGLAVKNTKALVKDLVIKSPMAGRVLKVAVKTGAALVQGDLICIVEAMKMENKIIAPRNGILKSCKAQEGGVVAAGEELARIGS